MPYDPNEVRDKNGMWTAGDAGNAIRNAASDMPPTMKKIRTALLRKHIDLLNQRLIEGGIGKKERRLIEARIENMSKEVLLLKE